MSLVFADKLQAVFSLLFSLQSSTCWRIQSSFIGTYFLPSHCKHVIYRVGGLMEAMIKIASMLPNMQDAAIIIRASPRTSSHRFTDKKG